MLQDLYFVDQNLVITMDADDLRVPGHLQEQY